MAFRVNVDYYEPPSTATIHLDVCPTGVPRKKLEENGYWLKADTLAEACEVAKASKMRNRKKCGRCPS